MKDLLLGIDVGATGIKAGLFQTDGALVALAGRRNAPVPQKDKPDWLVWEPEAIWNNVRDCVRECLGKIGDPAQVKGVACTGFGADGLPMSRDGEELYPFISWHCTRTAPEAREISKRVGDKEIYAVTGYHNYPINTLNRLLWLHHHEPQVLDKAHCWLQVQDYIAYRLSGAFSTDCTIASTTMMLDLASRTWSDDLLRAGNVNPDLLPPISEAGTQIGAVHGAASADTGLVEGTPVVTGGHDCEIGVLGAGVNDPNVFIDITGTWEILIALVDAFKPESSHAAQGLDYECHALPKKWICQSLMIAGGVTEWVRANFYGDVAGGDVYATMVAEAEVQQAKGVYLLPGFVRGMGPDGSKKALGTLLGLTTVTRRGQVVRAALEGLCFQLCQQRTAVAAAVGRSPDSIRVVGGGQKNPLWLQMKADMLNLPVEVSLNPEVTLLGVAILAGIGAGVYKDISEALAGVAFPTESYLPDPHRHSEYKERYEKVYAGLATALEPVYNAIDDELA